MNDRRKTTQAEDDVTKVWGPPTCANCGHDLSGLVDSSKCTECGRPLVEVLVRKTTHKASFRRYTSRARILGLPALSIARGVGPDGQEGHARGWIAIGDKATGVIALGGLARGIVAMGGMSMGVFTVGGMSLGLFGAFGGMAVSLAGLAVGGMAAGFLATGGMAIGVGAVGGTTIGWCAWGPPRSSLAAHRVLGGGGTAGDPTALQFFDAFAWLFGPAPGPIPIGQPMVWLLAVMLGVAALLAAPAVLRWARGDADDGMRREP
jgi:hypothetical protein